MHANLKLSRIVPSHSKQAKLMQLSHKAMLSAHLMADANISTLTNDKHLSDSVYGDSCTDSTSSPFVTDLTGHLSHSVTEQKLCTLKPVVGHESLMLF
eukprot:c41811_g1_i1 orf=215-508(+)